MNNNMHTTTAAYNPSCILEAGTWVVRQFGWTGSFITRFATKEKAEAYAKDRMKAHFADPSKEHDRFYCEVEPILSWEDQKAAEAEGKQVRICIEANRTTGKVDITYRPPSY